MSVYWLSAICLFVVSIGLIKMIIDTKTGKKNIFYYNASPTPTTHCPKCGHPIEPFYFPTTFRQIFFGDWVCKNCRKEFTRFGDEVKR